MKQKLKRRDLCCAFGLSLGRQIAAIKGKKSARLDNLPACLPAHHFELPGKKVHHLRLKFEQNFDGTQAWFNPTIANLTAW